MEESKLDRIKTGTKKLFGRTNERLKQKIGRSSEPITKDDKWQVHVANFNRQQAAGLKLHREVKGYIASLKTLENSTQTLLDAIREMHEYTWPGNMSLVKALQGLDKLTKELNVAMVDSMLVPVNNYIEVFPDIKERMSKRERKLLDYTRCKRSLDTLKKGDKISSEKLGMAQEEYSEHKMIYEELNNELCEDLPEFWNSRKPFITKFLDGFFKQNMEFHREFAQVHTETYASLDPLKESLRNEPPAYKEIGETDKYFVVTDNARKFKRQSLRKSFRKGGGSFKRSMSMGAMAKKQKRDKEVPKSMANLTVDPNPYTVPPQQATPYTPSKNSPAKLSPPRPKPPRSPRNEYVNDNLEIELDIAEDDTISKPRRRILTTSSTTTAIIDESDEHDYAEVSEKEVVTAVATPDPAKPARASVSPKAARASPKALSSATAPVPAPDYSTVVRETVTTVVTTVVEPELEPEPETTPAPDAPVVEDEVEDEVARICAANDSSATPFSPSIKIEPGTEVECIHEYKAVDDDELTFTTGDVVTVVAWDSTDEQDEGWFMGVLQGTGSKGAFPINYTRKHNS